MKASVVSIRPPGRKPTAAAVAAGTGSSSSRARSRANSSGPSRYSFAWAATEPSAGGSLASSTSVMVLSRPPDEVSDATVAPLASVASARRRSSPCHRASLAKPSRSRRSIRSGRAMQFATDSGSCCRASYMAYSRSGARVLRAMRCISVCNARASSRTPYSALSADCLRNSSSVRWRISASGMESARLGLDVGLLAGHSSQDHSSSASTFRQPTRRSNSPFAAASPDTE